MENLHNSFMSSFSTLIYFLSLSEGVDKVKSELAHLKWFFFKLREIDICFCRYFQLILDVDVA